MDKILRFSVVVCVILVLSVPGAARGGVDKAAYRTVTQADLVVGREGFQGQKVHVAGDFLFTGSDFCYQIRKTKINTRDYFCFAVGTPSLVRMYLKKDHPQADLLLGLKKGAVVEAFGIFDFMGVDYNFIVVDEIAAGSAE